VTPGKRLLFSLCLLSGVIVLGVVGYLALGFEPTNSVYQTITTISTVGFREVEEFGNAEKWFTIALVLMGFASVVFAIGQGVEFVVEGHLQRIYGRRRMEKQIAQDSGHIVLCGWGRVGRSFAHHLPDDMEVVVIDRNEEHLAKCTYPFVVGDATEDDVLRETGLKRASMLIAALATDADNLFVVLSARAANPDVFIVARARAESTADKLLRAGADRVVNPHELGGARMAALVAQPHVAEFVDVVMHDRELEFQLGEVALPHGSHLVGQSLAAAELGSTTGALVLGMRNSDGTFTTNPGGLTELSEGQILIAIGTSDQLDKLRSAAEA
jgi:voltage-gated potassium channel